MIVGGRCFPTAAVGFNWRWRAIFLASASFTKVEQGGSIAVPDVLQPHMAG